MKAFIMKVWTPERLKELSETMGGQAGLARALDISPQAVSAWMTGKAEPSKFLYSKLQTLETRINRIRETRGK